MSADNGTPLAAVKNWKSISNVDNGLKEKIKYFYGFQTHLPDDDSRQPSAIFITTDDEVYAIGLNAEDNLLALEDDVFGKTIDLKIPRKINELSGKRIKKLTVSERFGAALTEDGKLLYWGMQMEMLQNEEKDKKYLQLPHYPRPEFQAEMMSCGGHSITFVTKEGQVIIWGCINLYYSTFYDFHTVVRPKDVTVESVSCGWYHIALLDDQGRAWTFGYGSGGELGYSWEAVRDGYITPRQVQLPKKCVKIACGANSTLFLLENGDVFACGNNLQLDHLCVGKKGHILQPLRVFLNDPITDIMAAYAWKGSQWQSRFTALSSVGDYFKWGEDSKQKVPTKQTGVKSLAEIYINFKTPQSYGNVIRTERDAIERPGNIASPTKASGQFESKAPNVNIGKPAAMPGPPLKKPQSNVTTSSQATHVPDDKNVSSSEEVVQPPGRSEPEEEFTKPLVSVGAEAEIKPELNVPIPNKPQISVSTTESHQPSPRPEDVSAGSTSSDSAGLSSSKPKNPSTVDMKGSANVERKPDKPPTRSILSKWTLFKNIKESLARTITRFMVFSGDDVGKGGEGLGSFFVTKNDDVYCIGLNADAKLLGLSGAAAGEDKITNPTKVENLSRKNIVKIVVSLQQGIALSKQGSVFTWNKELEPTMVKMEGDAPARDIGCGSQFTLVLTNNSNIYLNGELSYEFETETNKKISIPNGVEVKKIECGDWHGAFLTTDGDAYTFGHGVYEQLGYEQDPEDTPFKARRVALPHACREIGCGVSSTFFLLKNGDVFACGTNNPGNRLGVGHEEAVVLPEKVIIPEPVIDMAVVTKNGNFGVRGSLIAVKSVSGKIYKWGDKMKNPTIVENASSMIEAFEGQAIPQTMSMVSLAIQDESGSLPQLPALNPSQITKEPESADQSGLNVGEPANNSGSKLPEDEQQNEQGNVESLSENIPPAKGSNNSDTPSYGDSSNGKPETLSPSGGKATENPPVDDDTAGSSGNFVKPNVNIDENKPTGMAKENLLGDPLYSDVTIKLASGEIPAHKVLLYTKSPFFRHVLSRNDNAKELDLSAYKTKSVLALLKHLYGVPIGERVSIEDAADFQELAEKDGGSLVLEMSKLLLYSSTLYDVIKAHLDDKQAQLKAKVLKAILPAAQFP